MRRFVTLIAAALLLTGPGHAEGFKPTERCSDILERTTDLEKVLLGAWVTGYLDNVNESASLIRLDNAQVVLSNVARFCKSNPDFTLLQIVQSSQKNSADRPGSRANAELFLRQFLAPNADLAALTATLRPTEADIRAVYAPALADKLIPAYAAMFVPGAAIGPKPGQSEILSWRTTTGSLKRGEPALEDFPGGYQDVRPYLQGEFPIVRFKFVKPGKTTGMAYDGLIHLNGRWVFMPKPWRMLAE